MQKSISFYTEVLKLKVKSQTPDWVEFFNQGTVLALHPVKNKKLLKHGHGILVGFTVDDFENTFTYLKDKDVKFFKKPKDEPFGRHMIVKDPDGHLISIVQLSGGSVEEGFDLLGLVGAE